MPDRVPHDHPTVDTLDGTVHRQGGTWRPEIRIDGTIAADPGDLIRLVLDGSTYRAPVQKTTDGSIVLRHAAPTPRLARNPGESDNALVEWVRDHDLDMGRTVTLDIVDSGFRYGLRAPGETAVYETGKPTDSLADIAAQMDR